MNHRAAADDTNDERLEAEEARRILRDEMPKKIERLRRDFRDLYLAERRRASRDGTE